MSSGSARKLRRQHKQRAPPEEVPSNSEDVVKKYRSARALATLKAKLRSGRVLTEQETNLLKGLLDGR